MWTIAPVLAPVTGALVAVLAAGVAGCDTPPATAALMVPVYRFADAAWRATAETNQAPHTAETGDQVHTAAYPLVSIDNEVRYTLTRKIRAPLLYAPLYQAPSGGSVAVGFPVPPEFQPGDRVVVEPEMSWHSYAQRPPASVTQVQMLDGKPSITFPLAIPSEYANKTIGLHIKGTVIPKDTALYVRTAPTTVPQKAYLDFDVGIEDAAWSQGPVEFQVRACADSDCETLFREVLDPQVPAGRTWQARRVDLHALADRRVSFSFESRLLSDEEGAFSLPVWGNPTVYAPATSQDNRPNIVLISIDTLSAHHLPTYGYEFPTAPFIDGVLAREGTVFERAVAAATTTPQSHMSMFTSVQPCQHGIITGIEVVREPLVTIAEELRAAGFETGAVTEDGWLGFEHGFGRGFNLYAENKSANLMIPEGQIEATLAKARRWIGRNDDKRFFLFLHTFQVHEPYTPPDEYKAMFREREGIKIDDNSPRGLRDLIAYDQEIRYTDDQLKGFFDFLRQRGALDHTVIVFTSDHGEEFAEHGLRGHGRNLFDEVARVPLIFWGPGRIPQGVRDPQTVGHIDLMPTILALAGLGSPAQATGRNILAPAPAQGSGVSDFRFSESRVEAAIDKNFQLIRVAPPGFMVQSGTRKMSRYREVDHLGYEAYDLDKDPLEKRDLLAADPAGFETMKQLLDNYEAACAERVEHNGDSGPSQKIELDPEREKKLRALGYLQ